MTSTPKYIWMDGELIPYEAATVHFLTPALQYGAGVFEGIRCYQTAYGPAVFRLREHIIRLIHSAKILGFMSLPFTEDELVEASKETIKANEYGQCYIRPLIYLADSRGLNLDDGIAKVGIAVWEWAHYLGEEALEKGIRACFSSYTRHHINATMTKAKITGNYVNSILAKTQAKRMGFDETIMLDPDGYVAECSGENIFIVRHNTIYTPPRTTILEGITRDSMISLAKDSGYAVVEEQISRDQIYIADEIFVVGSAAECVGVYEVDYRTIGTGSTGPITREMQKVYQKAILGEHTLSKNWLDYVYENQS